MSIGAAKKRFPSSKERDLNYRHLTSGGVPDAVGRAAVGSGVGWGGVGYGVGDSGGFFFTAIALFPH